MSASLLMEKKLFGLFELDPAGTVLYCRMEPDGKPAGAKPDMVGRNFYEEVAPFENVEEFRHRVMQFTQGASAADNFNFDCQYEGCALPVKVLLARIHGGANNNRTKSVLVHIRTGA